MNINNLFDLPRDILIKIYQSLPPKEAYHLSLTCKKARDIYEREMGALLEAHYKKKCPEGIEPKDEYQRWTVGYSPKPLIHCIKTLNVGMNVRALQITPDGTHIISGSYEGSLKVWNRFPYVKDVIESLVNRILNNDPSAEIDRQNLPVFIETAIQIHLEKLKK